MKRIILAVGVLGLVSCAEQQSSLSKLLANQKQNFVTGRMDLDSPGQLTITDSSGQPIPNANVLIGDSPGNPFSGNTGMTDASGNIQLPIGFKTSLPVTIQATGFVTLTYANLTPSTQTLQMDTQEGANEIEIAGATTGFTGVVNGDGNIDFGLVVPALSRDSMLSFDLSTVLSPQTDTITIAGNSEQIPSNITLPNQTETYVVVPVTLNKPDYRTYVRNPGTYQVTSLHGWFPMNTVVGDIQNGDSYFNMINYFTFVSSGSIGVPVTGDTTGQDINVDQIPLDTVVAMRAPQFDASNNMLTLALAETNGLFYPTDVKSFTPGQALQLKASSQLTSRYTLSALVPAAASVPKTHAVSANDVLPIEQAFSAIFNFLPRLLSSPNFNQFTIALQTAGSPAPTFLPMVAAPVVSGTQVQISVPALPANLQAVGTYLTYVDILPVTNGDVSTEIRTRMWELWTEGWTTNFQLPSITFPAPATGHNYRWEVLFLAQDAAAPAGVGGKGAIDLSNVNYLTHNMVNVQ